MDPKWWWLIGMLGPVGAMGIVRTCIEAYGNWRRRSEPQLSIASTERVEALTEVLVELLPRIVGHEAGDCIITDQSSLSDFANGEPDLLRFRENVRAVYGIDPDRLPDDRLVTIAEAVAGGGQAQSELIRVLARVQVLTAGEGGRTHPFTSGYRPNHNFGAAGSREFFIGQVEVPENGWVYPGEARELAITFLNAVGLREQLTPGRRWRIQEGGRLVATAELLSLLPDS